MRGITITSDLIEVLISSLVNAKVSGDLIEVLISKSPISPTTITGAGVSQDVVEVLVSINNQSVKMSQQLIEVLMKPASLVSSDSPAPVVSASTKGWVSIS